MNLIAKNVRRMQWIDNGRLASFESPRGYAVVDTDTNQVLSFGGDAPSVWNRKSTANEIADTILVDDTLTWIQLRPE